MRTEIRVIKTQGDLVQDKPLQEFGIKGVFVQEIEQALLRGEIDLAVHSLKDMPAEQPEGLEILEESRSLRIRGIWWITARAPLWMK